MFQVTLKKRFLHWWLFVSAELDAEPTVFKKVSDRQFVLSRCVVAFFLVVVVSRCCFLCIFPCVFFLYLYMTTRIAHRLSSRCRNNRIYGTFELIALEKNFYSIRSSWTFWPKFLVDGAFELNCSVSRRIALLASRQFEGKLKPSFNWELPAFSCYIQSW